MRKMDRNTVRGPLYKQFDLERKSSRQAEARLSLRLQRLEVICLYHMKSLAREQRQLQKELQRLQQGEALPREQFPGAGGGRQQPQTHGGMLIFTVR